MSPVILFDGECNLCDFSVQFILKRDPKGIFQFASLQSDAGIALLEKYNVPKNTESIVLIEDGQFFTESTAALKIARKLTGLWKWLSIAIFVPKPIRDVIYKWIAKNRYKWFGKKEQCMLPTAEQKNRFLS
ncbi:thiol-disulfide oxidoreductase [Lysinibacillus sp. 2017]|uniref:thiol-disulfide oxidoreductase DCC family protein n=1 Tax=unclassified Lysinibacillus TaxID=2636778 RepID=UPI000D5289A5|nr:MULTISPECIES: thiol-disulfide oxidoreductase DCC family protein [unclassified Lysinibacillus]AWE08164.1 thiol-disulfide oxidoreductase [Lysinibacillus sp. 2017]TGN36332.1 thiol-disulfide oxidoreductase DCC family protein [Lysinibacillus sp. S2017]